MAELFAPRPGSDAPIVVVGAGETADMVREALSRDAGRTVVAHAVSGDLLRADRHAGLPLVPLEDLTTSYPPSSYEVMVGVSYVEGNRLRERLVLAVKDQGYRCASYVSTRAAVWDNVVIGENVCIWENAVAQHHATLGTGTTVWPGVTISHAAEIGPFVLLAAGATIGGHARIGARCFLGAGSTVIDERTVPDDTTIGAGATVLRDIEVAGTYMGAPARRVTDPTTGAVARTPR